MMTENAHDSLDFAVAEFTIVAVIIHIDVLATSML